MAVLFVIGIWWLATHGKGTAPGRLVAWLSLVIVVWLMVALKNPGAAGSVAAGFATSVSQSVTALGAFLGQF